MFFSFSLNLNEISSDGCSLTIQLSDKKPVKICLKYGKSNGEIMKIVPDKNVSIEWLGDIGLIKISNLHFNYNGKVYTFILEIYNDENQFFPQTVFETEGFIPREGKKLD